MRKVLEDLIFLGNIKEEVSLFGKKWVMETINSEQQLEVMSVTGNQDTLTRIYAIKIEILARAIKSVDDVLLSDLEENLEFIKKMQQPVVNKLYDEYEKLQQKQDDSLKDMESIKNS